MLQCFLFWGIETQRHTHLGLFTNLITMTPACLAHLQGTFHEYYEWIAPRRPQFFSDKERHFNNLQRTSYYIYVCFVWEHVFMSKYFCVEMIPVFLWPEGHILHSLSLSRVHFIGGRAAKKQANEVSRFTALPPIRKPMNGPLPKQASGTFMLGAVPIKLVTQHQPRNKNDRWSSRLFSQLLSLSLSLSLSLTSLSYLSKARERH